MCASFRTKTSGVIPWTVNEQDDLFAMMEMGVNGIITDRPDVLYKMR